VGRELLVQNSVRVWEGFDIEMAGSIMGLVKWSCEIQRDSRMMQME
jgi:hypothetical protein